MLARADGSVHLAPSVYQDRLPHHRADDGSQVIYVIGLRHHALEAMLAEVRHRQVARITARDDHLYAGIVLPKDGDRLLAAHAARYGQVHDDQVERVA